MASTSPILAIGDIRWEHIDQRVRLGGFAALFSARISALGHPVDLATSVGNDQAGEGALALMQSLGVGTNLFQHNSMLPTSSAIVRAKEGELPVYLHLEGAATGQLAETGTLMDSVDRYEALYFNSYTQTSLVAGTTLQAFLNISPPSFKIYDIRSLGRAPSREELEAGLQVASVVHLCNSDLPGILSTLGLPNLEPELAAPLFPERYGVSFCALTSPFEGVKVASIVGEQLAVSSQLPEEADLSEWHEAFLAGFIFHLLRGTPLSRCCIAGVQYADVTAGSYGELGEEELGSIRQV